ncbi:DNA polymerase III subunit epsilon [Wolbachia endosymbiont of Howardula sp.]|uniref:DNA polymerase III subunit epsilon n=1 Tax=Wolbachia endosymbiont of Howardula sp. TaxID=2916816 RepID=UPI00217E9CC7|nr:DNA polymerase III subunit epsilon [Wolbachia endosymbiont of Howardula sp.]UWI83085.1 DNA polymerase III subunit epsilon [Wolbachia endosymbiont of Howardula sp.]
MRDKRREVVLDTETTGLNPDSGHRVIEIGCIELINRIPTGKIFHKYLNPQRDVPYHSFKIHGISEKFLQDKPLFLEIKNEFLDFISDDILIIHNAEFDLKFLNMELGKIRATLISSERILDTLLLARQKVIGASASLDALCKRFNISLANRELHGALIDAQLLARVYVELTGGLQTLLFDNTNNNDEYSDDTVSSEYKVHHNITYRSYTPSHDEIIAHKKLLDEIKNPIWQY